MSYLEEERLPGGLRGNMVKYLIMKEHNNHLNITLSDNGGQHTCRGTLLCRNMSAYQANND